MRHVGVVIALLLVLAEVPVAIVGADIWNRVHYHTGGIAEAGGPGDPESVGARIFRAGVRDGESEIPRSVQRVPPNALSMVGCARCHGAFGGGGSVPVESGSAYAPPITYDDLMAAGYTDAGIGVAVRTGVDARGRTLSEVMPRWDLSDQEVAELIAHLKALSVPLRRGPIQSTQTSAPGGA
jgi:cytochrome c1